MESDRRYLFDTNAFLWAGAKSKKLSALALAAMRDKSATRIVSIASVWELQIKHGLGKLPLPQKADDLANAYIRELRLEPLGISFAHIGSLYALPPVHRDPFDRIIVAQAITERLTIVSPDPAFRAYPVSVLW